MKMKSTRFCNIICNRLLKNVSFVGQKFSLNEPLLTLQQDEELVGPWKVRNEAAVDDRLCH